MPPSWIILSAELLQTASSLGYDVKNSPSRRVILNPVETGDSLKRLPMHRSLIIIYLAPEKLTSDRNPIKATVLLNAIILFDCELTWLTGANQVHRANDETFHPLSLRGLNSIQLTL